MKKVPKTWFGSQKSLLTLVLFFVCSVSQKFFLSSLSKYYFQFQFGFSTLLIYIYISIYSTIYNLLYNVNHPG